MLETPKFVRGGLRRNYTRKKSSKSLIQSGKREKKRNNFLHQRADTISRERAGCFGRALPTCGPQQGNVGYILKIFTHKVMQYLHFMTKIWLQASTASETIPFCGHTHTNFILILI